MRMLQKFNDIVKRINDLAIIVAGRITQSWRIIVAGAAFLCLISVGLLFYALQPHSVKSSPQVQTVVVTQATTTQQYVRALDGVIVQDASSTNLLPYAVMVENSMDAWPLLGPARANVVIEAPVEGSITRFMLLFDPSATTTQIGPVRSARPYYVELANGIGAMYVHVGGSPDALSMLHSSAPRVEDLNEFYNGKYFWRSTSRFAPHNTYTSMERLNLAASSTKAEATPFVPFVYSDDVTSSSTTSSIAIPYQGVYRASWNYDSTSHLYQRSQNGRVERDMDGETVDVSNVVVILTDSQVLDEVGRLDVRTTGTGKALLFRDGTVQHGIWHRNAGENLSFETEDGRDMLFARGKTWISIITSDQAFANIVGN
jgi:hypothetical protein